MSSTNKALLRHFYDDIYSQGNLALADKLVAADYVSHDPAPGEAAGREGLKTYVAFLRRAFDHLSVRIDDQVAEGEKVVARLTISGVHKGEYGGLLPTGQTVSVPAIAIHRIVDGRIQESWFSWDALGMMQQLQPLPG